MNDVYLWCVTGMTALVAVNTVWRLWTERDRLSREDLSDEDRAFAWRIVIFLIFPLFTYLDLRTTIIVCEFLGGYVKDWAYGLLWFYAVPSGLPERSLMLPALFAGCASEMLLALMLLPALLFRPHPFLATLIGYTVAFITGFNLIVDPLLSFAGLGGPRWQMALTAGSVSERLTVFALFFAGALVYLALMLSQRFRFWFSSLSRPQATEELIAALSELKLFPGKAVLICRVGVLYERAGLRRRAGAQLNKLKRSHPGSVYVPFLEAYLSYRRRDYKRARQAFLLAAESPACDGQLKASLLGAAACSAFAMSDATGALNLSERALEFDDNCLVARMVKVDVFLRQGKKEQAGEEILAAMRRGMTVDIERNVPLDAERTLKLMARAESSKAEPESVHARL